LFSALAYKADIEAALAARAQEYLVKPNDLDRLEETIRRLLDQSSAAALRLANKAGGLQKNGHVERIVAREKIL
jgi:DNA-binding NarL/FixJ family response regulator